MTSQSHMRDEIDKIPEAVRRLITHSREEVEETAAALRALDPRLVVTIARGSSDNAAVFLKYAIERTMRLQVASLGPSLASMLQRHTESWNVPPRLRSPSPAKVRTSSP